MVRVYPLEDGGYGYEIVDEAEGQHFVQENNPFRRGFVPMTQEEATYFAQCAVDGISPVYEGDAPEPLPPVVPNELDEIKSRLDDVELYLADLIIGP